MAHVGTGFCRFEGGVAAVRPRYRQVVVVARYVRDWSRLGGRRRAVRQREHLRMLRQLQRTAVSHCQPHDQQPVLDLLEQ